MYRKSGKFLFTGYLVKKYTKKYPRGIFEFPIGNAFFEPIFGKFRKFFGPKNGPKMRIDFGLLKPLYIQTLPTYILMSYIFEN